MGMSVKTLGMVGTVAGVLGMLFGLLSAPAGYLLAAGAILMGVAALLRNSEGQSAEASWSGADEEAPVTVYSALALGMMALLATLFSSATGWSLATLLSGG
jgi:hypothetical protein